MVEKLAKLQQGVEEQPGARPDQSESALQRRLSLSDMLDLPSFAEVCRDFSELYKIGLKVYEEHGDKLVDIKSGPNELCAYMFGFANAKALCMRTAARGKDGPLADAQPSAGPGSAGIFSVPCFSGCRYLVMPVRHEGDVLGRVILGPFVPDELRELPPGLAAAVGQGFQAAKALELIGKMRRAPEATVARIMSHFGSIVDSLLFAGQKVFLTSQLHIEATRESFREIEAKNQELMASNERLRELDRLKSNFLATVSHELRTPLTSIIGYSEMLSQGMAGELNSEQAEYVRTILEKGESLLSLISSILDITQIEAGRVRLAFAPCDVNEIAKQAITSVLPQSRSKNLHVELRAAPEMTRPSVDREKIRQCIVNLLANAVKFTPEGGRIRVTVHPSAPPGMLPPTVAGFAISVEDSGIGIPRKLFERVFETFYQVDQSSTREYGGAGLGLAIVKSFVEAHDGKVSIDSEEGRYCRFVLALPYAPKAAETEIDAPF
ncbi:MAG: ATP-binding protein [Myxococcales bacterium]|jgi:two-component system sensor histidine kinase BarA